MSHPKAGSSSLVVSYLVLRKSVGCLGIALPFVLAGGGKVLCGIGIQSSISSYYHTGMRDVFVGILCAIAVFLTSYKGYDRRDDLAGYLAGFFAVVVALCPTTPGSDPSSLDKVIGGLHLTSAALFFLTLAYFSLFLFTKSDPTTSPTRRKLRRNFVYRVCGCVMLFALVLIALLAVLPEPAAGQVKRLDPLFWLESLAVVSFGVSWFIKGEAILKDEN